MEDLVVLLVEIRVSYARYGLYLVMELTNVETNLIMHLFHDNKEVIREIIQENAPQEVDNFLEEIMEEVVVEVLMIIFLDGQFSRLRCLSTSTEQSITSVTKLCISSRCFWFL